MAGLEGRFLCFIVILIVFWRFIIIFIEGSPITKQTVKLHKNPFRILEVQEEIQYTEGEAFDQHTVSVQDHQKPWAA